MEIEYLELTMIRATRVNIHRLKQTVILLLIGVTVINAHAGIRYDTKIFSWEENLAPGLTGYETELATGNPITLFHPENINGFVSYQGVDPTVGNGFGLAVNAKADLVQGHYRTDSMGSIRLEFTVQSNAPVLSVPISIRGAYSVFDVDDDSLFGNGAIVSATLSRGSIANGVSEHLGRFQASAGTEDSAGIWQLDAMVQLNSSHLLDLSATAIAVDARPDSTTFIPASQAFIDPEIIAADPETPITVQFADSDVFVQNPTYIAIPEPAPVLLFLAGCLVFGFSRRRQ